MPLYIVATPIGNLDDLTPRAAEMLRGASAVYAEDTRHSRKILDHIGADTRLVAYHDHSSASVADSIVERAEIEAVCLISDAGTPCISDPGFEVVRLARQRGVEVVPIPGASAVVAFLCAAGLPTDRFFFGGFLPSKGNARAEALGDVMSRSETCVLYESPRRTRRLLEQIAALDGERIVAWGRELTKRFEEFDYGSAEELAERFPDASERGEFVVGIAAAPRVGEVDSAELIAWIDALLDGGMRTKDVASVLSDRLGLSRSDVYQSVLARKNAR